MSNELDKAFSQEDNSEKQDGRIRLKKREQTLFFNYLTPLRPLLRQILLEIRILPHQRYGGPMTQQCTLLLPR